MIMALDFTGEVPIYQQIRNQVVLGIARGELAIGEVLPTVRQLAQDIGVNPMTVNKAYTMLRQEGLLETDRRLGTQVCAWRGDTLPGAFRESLELVLAQAAVYRLSEDEIKALIGEILATFRKGSDFK